MSCSCREASTRITRSNAGRDLISYLFISTYTVACPVAGQGTARSSVCEGVPAVCCRIRAEADHAVTDMFLNPDPPLCRSKRQLMHKA